MELRQLEYFSVVAKTGNMSAAAKQLHVSQPSLSMTIARLEEDLGVPLFDRIGGKIHLNRMGQDLLGNVNTILRQIDEMHAKADEQAGTAKGLVVFGVSEAGLVMHLIHAYLQQFPPLTFRQMVGDREALRHLLESGTLDFAIIKDHQPSQGIDAIPLLKEETIVIVSENHPLAAKKDRTVTAEELLEYPFVLNESALATNGEFHRLFRNFDHEPDIQLVSQESAVTMEAMRGCLGVGLLSSVILQISAGPVFEGIVPLRIQDADTTSLLSLCTLHGRFMPAAAQQFYTFTQGFFSSLPEL